jgi:Mor family transcriptional regulator
MKTKMLNKKETQTWSVMCDKCHKILDREYLKEVVEMMEKQQAQKSILEMIEEFGGWLILNYEIKTKEGILDELKELTQKIKGENDEK